MDPLRSFHRLRGVLRANASFSGAGGLVALVGCAPVDRLLGTGNRPLVAATGAGLLGFAGVVLAAASHEPRGVRRAAPLVIVADAAWVVATAVVVGVVDLEPAGVVVLVAVAVVVGSFAVAQARLAAATRLLADLDAPVAESVRVEHRFEAPPAAVWPVVTDHELYGRLAPNLSKVEVVEGQGTGMRRRCEDTLGRGWNETCTLWDEGHEYAVAVDTADHPYPLREMEGHWAVRPDGGGSLVTMRFRFVPRPGVAGGAFAAVMLLAFRPVLRRIRRGWERELASRASTAALAHSDAAAYARHPHRPDPVLTEAEAWTQE